MLKITNKYLISRMSFNNKVTEHIEDYLIKYNILIEVDGDFYHCNPNSKHNKVLYETQKLTVKNDKCKNTLCKNHNMTLIRYWEKDINERPDWVISDLKSKLSL